MSLSPAAARRQWRRGQWPHLAAESSSADAPSRTFFFRGIGRSAGGFGSPSLNLPAAVGGEAAETASPLEGTRGERLLSMETNRLLPYLGGAVRRPGRRGPGAAHPPQAGFGPAQHSHFLCFCFFVFSFSFLFCFLLFVFFFKTFFKYEHLLKIKKSNKKSLFKNLNIF
jgi:hypothetical protein